MSGAKVRVVELLWENILCVYSSASDSINFKFANCFVKYLQEHLHVSKRNLGKV